MDKQNINKTVTFSFAAAAILVWWVSGVLFQTLAAGVPYLARVRAYKVAGIELYEVGLPLIIAMCVFFYLQLSESKRVWAGEVVVEASKVVWPSQRDVQVSTIVVSIMLILSGVILFGMDALSSSIVDFILGR